MYGDILVIHFVKIIVLISGGELKAGEWGGVGWGIQGHPTTEMACIVEKFY